MVEWGCFWGEDPENEALNPELDIARFHASKWASEEVSEIGGGGGGGGGVGGGTFSGSS